MHARAVEFFRKNCSAGGGYVYRVSSDLQTRQGEEPVSATAAWIQPPGTPAVGLAYLAPLLDALAELVVGQPAG